MTVAATTALGAHDFIAAMPEGYETDVANRGGRLSAGQRQLVAFARALLEDVPPAPENQSEIVAANRTGRPLAATT